MVKSRCGAARSEAHLRVDSAAAAGGMGGAGLCNTTAVLGATDDGSGQGSTAPCGEGPVLYALGAHVEERLRLSVSVWVSRLWVGPPAKMAFMPILQGRQLRRRTGGGCERTQSPFWTWRVSVAGGHPAEALQWPVIIACSTNPWEK